MQEEQPRVIGTVVNANDRGFQLHGEMHWRNWSRYAAEPRTLPAPGDRIVVMLDDAGFVRSVLRSDPPAKSQAGEAQAAYNSGYAAVASKPVVAPASVASQPQAARNPQLDREFRLKCLQLAMESQQWLVDTLSGMEAAMSRAEQIAAWAEGKE